jgi:hypothetical protein
MNALEQRRTWLTEIKAAKDREARELPSIRAQEEKAAKVVRDLQAQLEIARRRLSEVRTRGSALSHRTHRTVAQHEFNLRQTCSPAIATFREKMSQLRPQLAQKIAYQEGPNVSGKLMIIGSTYASVQAAVARVNEIITRELPLLELEPIGEDGIQACLGELEASIPEIRFTRV